MPHRSSKYHGFIHRDTGDILGSILAVTSQYIVSVYTVLLFFYIINVILNVFVCFVSFDTCFFCSPK